jgi:hypothetical protein
MSVRPERWCRDLDLACATPSSLHRVNRRSNASAVEISRASREAVAVRFSRHAKNEMRLYKITVADVASVVATPRSTTRDPKGFPDD